MEKRVKKLKLHLTEGDDEDDVSAWSLDLDVASPRASATKKTEDVDLDLMDAIFGSGEKTSAEDSDRDDEPFPFLVTSPSAEDEDSPSSKRRAVSQQSKLLKKVRISNATTNADESDEDMDLFDEAPSQYSSARALLADD